MATEETKSSSRAAEDSSASEDWAAETIDAATGSTPPVVAEGGSKSGATARPTASPISLSDTVEVPHGSTASGGRAEESASWLAQAVPGYMRGVESDDDMSALPAIGAHCYNRADEIARGGMGRIIEARDRRLGRTVAIKELLAQDAGFFARFEREARITARLEHPSIVPVYEAGISTEGKPFYAMKLLAGESLDRVVAGTDGFRERLALIPAITQVAEALAYAHSKHIVHRDLKPANVIIGEFGEIVVIDWGLAKDLRYEELDELLAKDAEDAKDTDDADAADDPDEGADSTLRTADTSRSQRGLTMAGAAMGTPSYMPPEQAMGESVDERADVYALGAMLYHVLSGEMAYADCETPEAVLVAVITEAPRPLSELVPEAPADLVAIVEKAMARDPEERYRSARELAEDLSRFTTGQLVSVHEYSLTALFSRFIARHRAVVAVAGSMLLVLAVLAVLSVQRIRHERNLAEEQRVLAQSQRAVAEAAQVDAEVARARAEARSNDLIVTHAQNAMVRDPTGGLAWLTQVAPQPEYTPLTRLLALEARARGVARHVLEGHNGRVHGLAFSRDGRYLATSGTEGDVRVWSMDSGALVREDRSEARRLVLAWAPSGQWLAAADGDGTILRWNPETDERARFSGTGAEVRFLAIAPDGARVAATTADRNVLMWRLGDPEPVVLARSAEDFVRIAFSPDGSALILSQDARLAIIDATTGAPRPVPAGVRAYSMAMSPDGRWLAAADGERAAYLWPAGDIRPSSVLTVRHDASAENEARLLAFSSDGRYLAMNDGAAVRVVEVATRTVATHRWHEEQVTALVFSPDSRYLASGSRDQAVHLFDVATQAERYLVSQAGDITQLAFAPDGRSLASASRDGTVRVWPMADGVYHRAMKRGVYSPLLTSVWQRYLISGDADGTISILVHDTGERRALRFHESAVQGLDFAADAALLASFDKAGTIGVHRLGGLLSRNPDAPLFTSAGAWSSVELPSVPSLGRAKRLALSPDGRILAMAFERGAPVIYRLGEGGDIEPSRPPEPLAVATNTSQIALSPDGQLLGFVGDAGAGVWQRRTGRVLALDDATAEERSLVALSFSPDGRILATGGADRTARLWALDRPDGPVLLSAFADHADPVERLAFAPDGRHLAVGMTGGTIAIWDVERGQRVRTLEDHHHTTMGLLLAADGRTLLSSSWDGTVRAWDIFTGAQHIWWRDQKTPPLLRFSDDGQSLVFGTMDGITIWPFGAPVEADSLHRWMRQLSSVRSE